MIREVFNMARFHLPSKMNGTSKQHLAEYIAAHFSDQVRQNVPESEEGSQYCIDLSAYDIEVNELEQKKHDRYENDGGNVTVSTEGGWVVKDQTVPSVDGLDSSTILDDLTADDIRHLMETEDEISQAKG